MSSCNHSIGIIIEAKDNKSSYECDDCKTMLAGMRYFCEDCQLTICNNCLRIGNCIPHVSYEKDDNSPEFMDTDTEAEEVWHTSDKYYTPWSLNMGNWD